MNKFYLTTAIPYVNAAPHVGHALEFVQADTIKRTRILLGDEVLLLSGSDENALKNVQAAEKEGKNVQGFVDENSVLFQELAKKLNIDFDVFQKGSNPDHFKSSQKLWELCDKNGDIYKKEYSGLYCVGCEAFYELEELNENGECFEHPGKKLEEVTETNYFFKLSRYQEQLENLIENDELKITPVSRKNEVLGFLKQGLKDISISRSNTRAKNWGVPVPGDDTQRMYVWFDALNIYQSGIGFALDEKEYDKWWPADVHVIGKGIIKFHAIYWPAFLISAGLKLPKSLFVHGYFTVDGQKMSKTIGNVIDPIYLIDKYGVDGIRYYFLNEIPPTSDGDFAENKLKEIYNANLANGIGNLTARVAKLSEKVGLELPDPERKLAPEIVEKLTDYKFNEALGIIWEKVGEVDKKINQDEPWKLEGEALSEKLRGYASYIIYIGANLAPFMPETSEKIMSQFSGKVKSSDPLFPRLS
ncbi:MAG TPA: methionine--tRNA ligase [Patescibacteria group bacterium]|nr:methionine--tRNA ligase [Patescibacteria group bacterium]